MRSRGREAVLIVWSLKAQGLRIESVSIYLHQLGIISWHVDGNAAWNDGALNNIARSRPAPLSLQFRQPQAAHRPLRAVLRNQRRARTPRNLDSGKMSVE